MTVNDQLFLRNGELPAWVSSKFSKKIFGALGVQNVRFVGGAVRDAILDVSVSDIDMATTHKPDAVVDKLNAVGLKVIPTGLKHGTVTAVFGDEMREITTLRVDQQTDGRHAVVSYTDNWFVDAERRDFTINAMYLSADGALYDPFDGLADLNAHRVRFIGDPTKRIEEDALRILRFYRFSSRYADNIDHEGQRACRSARDKIKTLSTERVRDELLKLLSGTSPQQALMAMFESGVSESIFPDGFDALELLEQLEYDDQSKVHTSAITRLWLLAGEDSTPARLASKFKLSGAQKRHLSQVASIHAEGNALTEKHIRQLFYSFDPLTVCEAVYLMRDNALTSCVHEQAKYWEQKTLPVSAHDLMALGQEAGPGLGDALKSLETKWLDSDFSLSKEELLNLITS
ncbi:CCA tRNA nucleotidyltransferase [Kordiimonas aquimaris]|uniref:CCA tRNA nucleotidyltransferase n=1 Tax=Kordiimonas aquimaris TaxID=707591 RepID=UPI0021D34EE5|nr:CCA tRNA nucleotidyltransferase [Kordiimonas aquimaris]